MAWKQWKTRPALRPDWEPRLNAYLEQIVPHEWGSHDCLLYIAGAVEAQTGRDFAKDHRGKYDSEAGSRRYLKTLGFASPRKLLDSLLDKIPPAFAKRGDVVLAKLPKEAGGGSCPAVVIGGEALALVHGLAGPIRIPRQFWAAAWRVGD
jgi:hypothetical protein